MSAHDHIAQDAMAAAPKVAAAAGIVTFAAELDPWIKILGFVYIVLQIAFLGYRAWAMRKNKKDSE